jgi:transposase
VAELDPSINQTVCQIREIDYCMSMIPCDRCQKPAGYFTAASRTAIDLNLEHPVLLRVAVSVHYCAACDHYFRAQPPFLRRDAIYSNRVVAKAVQSVYEDGMAIRRTATRIARDFWVQPSESMIREWCQDYSAGFDFETEYQPWVVAEFSGILCVDEVYQDRLALLLAVDPAAPDGDRLVGYQLIHGSVDAKAVEGFLLRLKKAGIEPDEVVTDGSQLYPAVLAQVWPQAAHQLCLFHATRHVTQAAMKAINAIRKAIPHPPPTLQKRGGGPLHTCPPSENSNDPETQRWYWRQAYRRTRIAQVHELAEQGLSLRAISRQTGHHRLTIRRWLKQVVPALPEGMPVDLYEQASLPAPVQRQEKKQELKQRVRDLRQQGRAYSAIAAEVEVHRVTVKKWLQEESSADEQAPIVSSKPDVVPVQPPEGWSSWEEVRQVREALQEHRFLLIRRPENLDQEQQEKAKALLASPLGPQLQIVRSFLEDWYGLWMDDQSQRRSLADALARYQTWKNNPAYRAVPQLRHLLERMTDEKFERLSQFLRNPAWEATNNGAERGGRAFRHRQAPHFNLRKKEHIAAAINVTACLRRSSALRPSIPRFHRCQRGRRRQPVAGLPMAMAPV